MSIESLASLANPCSEKYQACQTFKTALNAKQKAAVVAITALVAILSLPFFGILAVAAFRTLVRKFFATATVHGQPPQKLNFESLRSSSSSIEVKEKIPSNESIEDKIVPGNNGAVKPSAMIVDIQSAIEREDLDRLRLLITPENINTKDEKGKTPLIGAAAKKNSVIVKFLLDNGADRTLANDYGVLALHLAAENGSLETVRELVNHATINSLDLQGTTPLIGAARNGHSKVVRFLLDHGADHTIEEPPGIPALHCAALIGSLETVRELVNKDTINVQTKEERQTPLFFAVRSNNPDVVKFLLENGADPHIPNSFGEIPIDFARDKKIIEMLHNHLEK